ncbi:MAG: hypothetical protein IPH82_25460 [Chloroflexi bacterium]|nr:hypothetical protein [Chloroflexota bacterium]
MQRLQQKLAITKGTLFYRLRTDPKVVIDVRDSATGLGCPTQAIVQAFGFDERRVKNGNGGHQCEVVHEHLIGQSRVDLQKRKPMKKGQDSGHTTRLCKWKIHMSI